MRRSVAMYYYTRSRPVEECLDQRCDSAHTTLSRGSGDVHDHALLLVRL